MAMCVNFLHGKNNISSLGVCKVEVGIRQDPLVDIDLPISGGTFLVAGPFLPKSSSGL
jgi:hypothetical protein